MTKTKKVKRKVPVILILILIICIVPCAILGAILFQSLEDSSNPVVGNRYETSLDPAITEEQLTNIQTALQGFDGVESVEVNLKTARLAILLNTNDDKTQEDIEKITKDAYAKVNELLPVETYFTNYTKEENPDFIIKMYDLQIDAYNITSGENQIHYVISKTGAQETELLQLVSSPKDQEVTDEVLNQNKGE